MKRFSACILFAALTVVNNSLADPGKICRYRNSAGQYVIVDDPAKIPSSFSQSAQCAEMQGSYLAAPEELKLKGAVREESMSTSLGHINLRWPRSAETLFGRTPQRAMAEAAQAVARSLKQGGFPPAIQNLALDWNVVFMDADLPETQIPAYLQKNCHPGWMVPPSSIYIVSQRITSGCNSGRARASSTGDARLAEVIIHEMGHAVEYAMLGGKASADRVRSEGFATWFEAYATEFSPIIPNGSVKKQTLDLAKILLREGVSLDPARFKGTAEEYALSSLYFFAVSERRGIRGISALYALMAQERLSLIPAIMKLTGWTEAQFAKEIKAAAGKQ